jgi:hypothetical protein
VLRLNLTQYRAYPHQLPRSLRQNTLVDEDPSWTQVVDGTHLIWCLGIQLSCRLQDQLMPMIPAPGGRGTRTRTYSFKVGPILDIGHVGDAAPFPPRDDVSVLPQKVC